MLYRSKSATFSPAYVEAAIYEHFFNVLRPLLVLPGCRSQLIDELYEELEELVLSCDSFRHAILACSAVHMDISGVGLSSQAALTHYSQSISLVKQSLAIMDKAQVGNDNGLLLSVIFLYVYNVSRDFLCSVYCSLSPVI